MNLTGKRFLAVAMVVLTLAMGHLGSPDALAVSGPTSSGRALPRSINSNATFTQSTPRLQNGVWSTRVGAEAGAPPNHWWLKDYWNDENTYGRFTAISNTMMGLESDDDLMILPLNLAYGSSVNLEWFQFDIDFHGSNVGTGGGWWGNVGWWIWNIDAPTGCALQLPLSAFNKQSIGLPYTPGHLYEYSGIIASNGMFRFHISDLTASTQWQTDLSVPYGTSFVYDAGCFSPASALEGYTTLSSLGNVPYYQFFLGYGMSSVGSVNSVEPGGSIPTGISMDELALLSSPASWYWTMTGDMELAVRDQYNNILYGKGQNWKYLPGATPDSPAAATCGGYLYFAVRGMNNGIYVGDVKLSTDVFSGWTKLDGATPSAPALAAVPNTCALYLVVRGSDNKIYLRVGLSMDIWTAWQNIPGSTVDGPAAAVGGSLLHIAVRGNDGFSIYHGRMDVTNSANMNWLGWTKLPGSTPSKPALTAAMGIAFLAVRGSDNRVYLNTWLEPGGYGWTGWNKISTGSTPNGPSVTSENGYVYIAVRGYDNWVYKVAWKLCCPPAWGTWLKPPPTNPTLSGSTPSSPAITSEPLP